MEGWTVSLPVLLGTLLVAALVRSAAHFLSYLRFNPDYFAKGPVVFHETLKLKHPSLELIQGSPHATRRAKFVFPSTSECLFRKRMSLIRPSRGYGAGNLKGQVVWKENNAEVQIRSHSAVSRLLPRYLALMPLASPPVLVILGLFGVASMEALFWIFLLLLLSFEMTALFFKLGIVMMDADIQDFIEDLKFVLDED